MEVQSFCKNSDSWHNEAIERYAGNVVVNPETIAVWQSMYIYLCNIFNESFFYSLR